MKLVSKLKEWGNKAVGKKKEAKKKVQHREMKECPYCHNHFGNLKNHIRDSHPTEAPSTELTKEELLRTQPPKPKPDSKVYYCQDCRAKIRKGEGRCWDCGKSLNWAGIE